MAETKYIVYLLGKQRYCMQLSKISGIEQVYNVVPVPMGAPYIKGIIHLREQVIPIYDLKHRFEIMDEPIAGNRQLLIAETHNIKIGFEVDDVLGIVAVPEEDIKDVPSVVKSDETGYLENVVKIKLMEEQQSDIMISVSVDRIMSEHEFDSVSNALEETQNGGE